MKFSEQSTNGTRFNGGESNFGPNNKNEQQPNSPEEKLFPHELTGTIKDGEVHIEDFGSVEDLSEILDKDPFLFEQAREEISSEFPDIQDPSGVAQVLVIQRQNLQTDNPVQDERFKRFVAKQNKIREQSDKDFEQAGFF